MGKLDELFKSKSKKVPLSRKAKRLFKLDKKRTDHVIIQYLTQKYTVRWLLQKVVGGNVVIIDNKVHELNPRNMFRDGKRTWYIIKEIDRKPVSNEDYDRVKARGDSTEADVPLIKAVLGAVQKKPMLENKNIIIVVGVIIIAGIVLWVFFGGGA